MRPLPSQKAASCRTSIPCLDYLKQIGKDPAEIFRGMPGGLEKHSDPARWLTWDEEVEFLIRLEKAMGGAEHLPEVTYNQGKSPIYARFARLLGFFTTSKLFYWSMVKVLIPQLFPTIRAHYRDLGDQKIEVTLEIPNDYRDCPQFFYMWIGGFRSLPRLFLGQQDAVVNMIRETKKAVYLIDLPPSLSIFARLSRAWKILFAAKTAMEEISIRDKALQEQAQDLNEIEMRLRLQAQMTTLSRMASLGEMAHEMNNPLAIIQISAEAALEHLKDKKEDGDGVVEKRLETIVATTNRMAAIIQGLRVFSKEVEAQPCESVSINKVIQDTLQFCREKFKSNGVNIEFAAENPDLSVECRPTQVSQALLNLLNNAFDAAYKPPSKWIRIETKDLGPLVEIAVVDSGTGLPENIRKKLFQPFFTTKAIGMGVGLGLSTSKGLIESHQGTLSLDIQSPNTRFVIRLPKNQNQEKNRVSRIA